MTRNPGSAPNQAWGGIQLVNGAYINLANNEIAFGLGHGITLGSLFWAESPGDYTGWFDITSRVVTGEDEEDCPANTGGFPLTAAPPGEEEDGEFFPLSAPSDLRIVNNHIHSMGSSGISVLGFWPVPGDAETAYFMIESHDLTIAENIIEKNFQSPPVALPPPELIGVVAFGGIVLANADNLRIRDNVIRDNGVSFIDPVCGVYVFHGEDIVVENNRILDNGKRTVGTGKSGNRAGIALQLVGRRVTPLEEEFDVDPDRLLPAASVRGNVVRQPAGRALQIYGLGAMLIEGNALASQGPAGQFVAPSATEAHCVEIHNIGQSPEIQIDDIAPANVAIFPAPPLYYDTDGSVDAFLEGRILFVDNQVRYSPFAGNAANIFCAVRIQTYGDAAVLNNQFFTSFPDGAGTMMTDTFVVGWSVRVNNNRWEDPAQSLGAEFQTDASAVTFGLMNYTTQNVATRCIHATASGFSPVTSENPHANNVILTSCLVPGFAPLLAPP